MFYQIFLSPEVKRCAIITYKHDIYELPHELLNDLRLRHRTTYPNNIIFVTTTKTKETNCNTNNYNTNSHPENKKQTTI